ncbi:polysaccharide deacetylase family protein [Microvenator marinus]|jgi:peptidoglycan/xylan/chitin deacetylase (PgdA/CDA1 family)|uniref:Polysaccharide deacetylase family protein n=1 Tax=Microvenator marinus TaxID=2600177 RepID=A0A5B8Y2D6_9DELT|nr:polysaccharide deacetylase family protein [Microvenator marinus]QED29859.1 polysaccharide deacetylase family protein [Microvenator marinus]
MKNLNWMFAGFLALSLSACGTDAPDPEFLEDNGEPYTEDGIEAWGEAFDDLQSGKADTSGCNGVYVPDPGGFGGKVSLTFDDGPHPTYTNMVLDTLAQHGIKATFFINGKRVNSQAARDALKRIVDEGHILANHSHNHSNLGTMADLARVEAEVDNTHTIIEGAGVTPEFFRFPFGSSNCSTADLVRSFGYKITGWHTDSADWCFASATGGVGYCDARTFKHVPDAVRDNMGELVMQQVYRKNGGIVLFHDVNPYTAESLDGIIQQMKASEMTFVNLDDLNTFPLLNGEEPAAQPWVGSECEDSDTCSFAENASCLSYDEGGFCVMPCEGFCSDFPGRAGTFCVSLDGGETGSCVSKSAAQNSNCAALPGTVAVEKERYVGTSSAPLSTAIVCLPEGL